MKPFAMSLSVLLVLLSCAPAIADDEDMADFKGNIALVFLAADGPGFPLIDAKMQSIGGRQFLVGVGANSHQEGDWVKGLKLKVAFDRVTTMAIFSPTEWEAYCAKNGKN